MTTTPVTGEEALAELLAGSYRRVTGRPLVPDGVPAAGWLREAPFGLLAHDTSADPVFVYANRTAQSLFGYHRDELLGLPSRLSAGPADREARQEFMTAVLRDGYADDYRGLRVRKDGGRFWIEDATVWNLIDGEVVAGQAALIRSWTDA